MLVVGLWERQGAQVLLALLCGGYRSWCGRGVRVGEKLLDPRCGVPNVRALGRNGCGVAGCRGPGLVALTVATCAGLGGRGWGIGVGSWLGVSRGPPTWRRLSRGCPGVPCPRPRVITPGGVSRSPRGSVAAGGLTVRVGGCWSAEGRGGGDDEWGESFPHCCGWRAGGGLQAGETSEMAQQSRDDAVDGLHTLLGVLPGLIRQV